jgi:hypothetical protein
MECRFVGDMEKKFVPMKDRVCENDVDLKCSVSKLQYRKIVSDQYYYQLKKNLGNSEGIGITNGLKQ